MASVTNTYASYATTYEEYQVQRYEGGSTLYGPHTTDAYIQTAVAMAAAMVKGEPVVSAVSPPDLEAQQISLFQDVSVDTAGVGEDFGAVLKNVRPEYKRGQAVQVEFRWVVRGGGEEEGGWGGGSWGKGGKERGGAGVREEESGGRRGGQGREGKIGGGGGREEGGKTG